MVLATEKKMETRSNSLFHFTKSEEILYQIFKHGFWPRYCLEDISWQGYEGFEYVAFPMVCFCDIPIARISEHIDFYGSYGIGLSKNWAEKNNMNPLLYISPGSDLSHTITKTVSLAMKSPQDSKDMSKRHATHFFAHIKPTSGTIMIDGKPVSKVFYQESEWRYIPRQENIPLSLLLEDYNDQENLIEKNEETRKNCMVKFLPNDVSFVFVPKDSDIPNIINFMQSELDHYPSADLKVLFSRVISIESVNENI
jgi:hypothetical protein